MDKSWKKIFDSYPKKNELKNLIVDINNKRQNTTIFPKEEQVFRVFELPLNEIKVVILGQDPYHNENQACGLSFSVNKGVALPKSLINIYKELFDDLGVEPASSGDLTPWFKQGVFLLNAVLTVEKNKPASHSNLGWQDFTNYIIKNISDNCSNIVFVLWGNFAREKKYLIDSSKHFIIESAHPSPLSAYRGFFGSKPFSKINNYLKSVNKKEINFKLN